MLFLSPKFFLHNLACVLHFCFSLFCLLACSSAVSLFAFACSSHAYQVYTCNILSLFACCTPYKLDPLLGCILCMLDPLLAGPPKWWTPHLLCYYRDPAARPMLPWNHYDSYTRVDRKSILGTYKVQDGLPLNPLGRTGLIGRGLLGRWGPNHCGDPVVTRYRPLLGYNMHMKKLLVMLVFKNLELIQII